MLKLSLQSICRFIEVEVWIRVCAACAERQSLSIMHDYWPGWRRGCYCTPRKFKHAPHKFVPVSFDGCVAILRGN